MSSISIILAQVEFNSDFGTYQYRPKNRITNVQSAVLSLNEYEPHELEFTTYETIAALDGDMFAIVYSDELYTPIPMFVRSIVSENRLTTVRAYGLKEVLKRWTVPFSLSTDEAGTSATGAPRTEILKLLGPVTTPAAYNRAPSSIEDYPSSNTAICRSFAVSDNTRYSTWWYGRTTNGVQSVVYPALYTRLTSTDTVYDQIDNTVRGYSVFFQSHDYVTNSVDKRLMPTWDILPDNDDLTSNFHLCVPIWQPSKTSKRFSRFITDPSNYTSVTRLLHQSLYTTLYIKYTSFDSTTNADGSVTANAKGSQRMLTAGGGWGYKSSMGLTKALDITAETRERFDAMVTRYSGASPSDFRNRLHQYSAYAEQQVFIAARKFGVEELSPRFGDYEVDSARFLTSGIKYGLDFRVGDYVFVNQTEDPEGLYTITDSTTGYNLVRVAQTTFTWSNTFSIRIGFEGVFDGYDSYFDVFAG